MPVQRHCKKVIIFIVDLTRILRFKFRNAGSENGSAFLKPSIRNHQINPELKVADKEVNQ